MVGPELYMPISRQDPLSLAAQELFREPLINLSKQSRSKYNHIILKYPNNLSHIHNFPLRNIKEFPS